jgi:uncharacterized protein
LGAVIVAASVYGGYFNGGLGILMLAAFSLIGFGDLHAMNGFKNVLSALLSTVLGADPGAGGADRVDAALLLAAATTAGGYLGASAAGGCATPHGCEAPSS